MAYVTDIDDMDDAPDEEMDEMEVEDDPDAIVDQQYADAEDRAGVE